MIRVKDRAKPNLPPVEPGVYISICVGVIDLGEQLCEYKNKKTGYQPKVQFVWELVGETVEVDGETKPRQLSRIFTISSSKKGHLMGFISSWNGVTYTKDQFGELDLCEQVGKACQLNVVLNDSGEYANVNSAIPLPKGMPVPSTETPMICWDMDKWDDDLFAALPEWVQEKIKKSIQYQKLHAPEDTIDFPESVQGKECPF